MTHFTDRLTEACRSKGNALCVGLDPRWEALPRELRERHADGTLAGVARAIEAFCLRVIDLVAGLVPVVKPQAAFFELCGPPGLIALQRVLRRAREQGLLTILDGKRNDIASTATAYADAAFGGVTLDGTNYPIWNADALTVNPYLGRDAVEPFLHSARRTGCGVFILVRTSNPGARQFQDLECDGQPVFRHVAAAVQAWRGRTWGGASSAMPGPLSAPPIRRSWRPCGRSCRKSRFWCRATAARAGARRTWPARSGPMGRGPWSTAPAGSSRRFGPRMRPGRMRWSPPPGPPSPTWPSTRRWPLSPPVTADSSSGEPGNLT